MLNVMYSISICFPDINECSEGEDQSFDKLCHFCQNTAGGYNCTCRAGYAVTKEEPHQCIGIVPTSWARLYSCTYLK